MKSDVSDNGLCLNVVLFCVMIQVLIHQILPVGNDLETPKWLSVSFLQVNSRKLHICVIILSSLVHSWRRQNHPCSRHSYPFPFRCLPASREAKSPQAALCLGRSQLYLPKHGCPSGAWIKSHCPLNLSMGDKILLKIG